MSRRSPKTKHAARGPARNSPDGTRAPGAAPNSGLNKNLCESDRLIWGSSLGRKTRGAGSTRGWIRVRITRRSHAGRTRAKGRRGKRWRGTRPSVGPALADARHTRAPPNFLAIRRPPCVEPPGCEGGDAAAEELSPHRHSGAPRSAAVCAGAQQLESQDF